MSMIIYKVVGDAKNKQNKTKPRMKARYASSHIRAFALEFRSESDFHVVVRMWESFGRKRGWHARLLLLLL